MATLPNVTLPLGANSLTAMYEGDTGFSPSTAPAVTVSVAEGGKVDEPLGRAGTVGRRAVGQLDGHRRRR